jgi:hypothetical protein
MRSVALLRILEIANSESPDVRGDSTSRSSRIDSSSICPAAPVRALSREERELMIAANSGYLLAF